MLYSCYYSYLIVFGMIFSSLILFEFPAGTTLNFSEDLFDQSSPRFSQLKAVLETVVSIFIII